MGVEDPKTQSIIRWLLLVSAVLCTVVGVILLGIGASGTNIGFYGITVGGIVLICFGVVIGASWLIGGCCCDSTRWCCEFSCCNKK